MSERKVLNKYYPPDFDPAKVPRLKREKNRQFTIRLMAPFNMRCTTCGEYIYRGKKFNARKEDVIGSMYLGIQIYRFYIKCTKCLAEITFLTDPENQDYAMENGAIRNFESLRLAEKQAETEAKQKKEEEENNPMKILENRTRDSRREMDVLDTLEDLRELNTANANVDTAVLLKSSAEEALLKSNEIKRRIEEQEKEEDEEEIRSIFGKKKVSAIEEIIIEDISESTIPISSSLKHKINDDTDSLELSEHKKVKIEDSQKITSSLLISKAKQDLDTIKSQNLATTNNNNNNKLSKSNVGLFLVKKKVETAAPVEVKKEALPQVETKPVSLLLGSLAAYGSDSEEE